MLQRFSGFEYSAGERPVPFQRLFAALDQEDPAAIEDQRADSQYRAFGIAAAIGHQR